jgi:hypothetical protein
MLTQEELAKQMKLITQNAWREASNTTVNNVCEYICRESLFILLDEFNKRLEKLEDASTDGGVSQPQRYSETEDKRGRSNAKARTGDAASGHE